MHLCLNMFTVLTLLICMAACSVTKSIVSLLSKCKYRAGKKVNELPEATTNRLSWRVFPVQLECKTKFLQCQLVKIKVFILPRNKRYTECCPSSLIHVMNKWLNCLLEFQSWENRRWLFQAYDGSLLWETPLRHLTSSQHRHQTISHFCAPTVKMLSFTFQHLYSQTAQLLSALQMAVHSDSKSREHSHNRDVVQSSINLYCKNVLSFNWGLSK